MHYVEVSIKLVIKCLKIRSLNHVNKLVIIVKRLVNVSLGLML
jgi:hypothetical protein